MEIKYKVGDIVYYVKDYKVVKSIIDGISVKYDAQGRTLLYILGAYSKKGKSIMSIEAQLVDTLEIAKQSALINWENITKQVKNDLINLIEKDFEPDEQQS